MKKQLQKKYDKLLKEFNEGHLRLEGIKMEMVRLRQQIKESHELSDERPDEILMKDFFHS